MSTKLSFKEVLERPGEIAAVPRVNSDFPTFSLALFAAGPIDQPVDFIRTVVAHGLSLKKARQVLERLALRHFVAVKLRTDDLNRLLGLLKSLGVEALELVDSKVDAKEVREKQGHSQDEFALLYGLEVATLKNWEQGLNNPDGPARTLLRVIERNPQAVIDARATAMTAMESAMANVLRRFQVPFTPFRVEILYEPKKWGLETWNPEFHVSYGRGISNRRSK